MVLIHDARLVAAANPIAPNGRYNANPKAMFAATETMAIRTGVAVSSRAKKPGLSTLTNTNAGRPRA